MSGITRQELSQNLRDKIVEFDEHKVYCEKGTMNRIQVRVSANGANGLLDFTMGNEFVQNILTDTYGLKINFKDIPSGAKVSANINYGSSEGLTTEKDKLDPYIYIREFGRSYLHLGLKQTPASAHIEWKSFISGVLIITIAW